MLLRKLPPGGPPSFFASALSLPSLPHLWRHLGEIDRHVFGFFSFISIEIAKITGSLPFPSPRNSTMVLFFPSSFSLVRMIGGVYYILPPGPPHSSSPSPGSHMRRKLMKGREPIEISSFSGQGFLFFSRFGSVSPLSRGPSPFPSPPPFEVESTPFLFFARPLLFLFPLFFGGGENPSSIFWICRAPPPSFFPFLTFGTQKCRVKNFLRLLSNPTAISSLSLPSPFSSGRFKSERPFPPRLQVQRPFFPPDGSAPAFPSLCGGGV